MPKASLQIASADPRMSSTWSIGQISTCEPPRLHHSVLTRRIPGTMNALSTHIQSRQHRFPSNRRSSRIMTEADRNGELIPCAFLQLATAQNLCKLCANLTISHVFCLAQVPAEEASAHSFRVGQVRSFLLRHLFIQKAMEFVCRQQRTKIDAFKLSPSQSKSRRIVTNTLHTEPSPRCGMGDRISPRT